MPDRGRSGSAGLGEGPADAGDTFVPRLSQLADGLITVAPSRPFPMAAYNLVRLPKLIEAAS